MSDTIDPIRLHHQFTQCLGYALGLNIPNAFAIAKAAAKLMSEGLTCFEAVTLAETVAEVEGVE